ncbi:MAG: class I SAM-dependent methyltransferase [Solirubrobacteraceae bacterium]
MNEPIANEAERARWNDGEWAAVWPKREKLTTAVTGVLLERVAPTPGESVLDIGSGGGVAALAVARLIGTGTVVGADISAPLHELARGRADQENLANVSFVVADVQNETVPGGPFNVAISQFGVMFFDAPERAFANIRRQLVRGGRLGFACWRAAEFNRWFIGPALAGLVPPPPPPQPGRAATHPFSLADPDHTAAILGAAGWREITRTSHDLVVAVEHDAIVDRESLGFLGVPAEALDAAWDAVERQLAPITREDGLVDANLAFHVFTAVA